MKKISFTNHCLEKIEILRKHKINIDKETISNTVSGPEKTEEGYNDRKIAQKLFDEIMLSELFTKKVIII